MIKTITVRGVEIGSNPPQIIVPIVGKTTDEIISAAKSFENHPVNMVEWRADFFEDIFDREKTLNTLAELRAMLDLPLLFTFRTANEGGEKAIEWSEYTALNKAIAESGLVDLIDVEIFSGDDIARENIANIHAANTLVVGSNHDFQATPSKTELILRMCKMQELNADICKIAVMPNSEHDVLTLLDATSEMHNNYADRPLLTLSMKPLGVISRLCGEVFGSCATFGTIGQGSAPGQIPVDDLAEDLQILHKSL